MLKLLSAMNSTVGIATFKVTSRSPHLEEESSGRHLSLSFITGWEPVEIVLVYGKKTEVIRSIVEPYGLLETQRISNKNYNRGIL